MLIDRDAFYFCTCIGHQRNASCISFCENSSQKQVTLVVLFVLAKTWLVALAFQHQMEQSPIVEA